MHFSSGVLLLGKGRLHTILQAALNPGYIIPPKNTVLSARVMHRVWYARSAQPKIPRCLNLFHHLTVGGTSGQQLHPPKT